MSDQKSARIRAMAAQLGLPHLAEALDEHVQRAVEAKTSHLDLIEWVLYEELAVRNGRGLPFSPSWSTLSHRRASPRKRGDA
ncbi:ATP-binding protein [Streptomyces longwoodensis]|uniref:ATP-binding protein n=1 Tax=Streptomyces longwoodensis TaxID=68231 RepID=UPI0033E1916E